MAQPTRQAVDRRSAGRAVAQHDEATTRSVTTSPATAECSPIAVAGLAYGDEHTSAPPYHTSAPPLFGRVQRKLEVGSSDDACEHEADDVARRVVAWFREGGANDAADESRTAEERPTNLAPLRRQSAAQSVARAATKSGGVIGPEGGALDPVVESALQSERGSGVPLPVGVRGSMQRAMRSDLGAVRVHTGARSTQLNDHMQARAFTVGNDIFFRDGFPDTSRPEGQELLAHELAHVVQQSGGRQIEAGRRRIQRILQTRKQIETAVGKAKGDVKAFGKTLKAMGTRYKLILDAVDNYHDYIARPVEAETIDVQVKTIDEYLDRVERACSAYLQGHSDDTEREEWIAQLRDKAAVERQVVLGLKAQAGTLDGKPWRDVLPQIGGETGGLDVPTNAAPEVRHDPGLEGKAVKAASLYADFSAGKLSGTTKPLTKDAQVIIHQTDDPAYVFVEIYEGGKELGTFKPKDSGYTEAKNVKVGSSKHETLPQDMPIFTREPIPDDVNQGAIGDCYLVAALAAIAASTPGEIYNMIKDNGDGTVNVRMFDPTGGGAPTAKYFTIQKSLVTNGRHSEGALWVPLLEKAYATMGVVPGGKVSKSYAKMGDGGGSDVAFLILTGRVAGGGTSDEVRSTRLDMTPPWDSSQLRKFDQGKADQTIAFKEMYGSDLTLTTAFMDLVRKRGADLDKLRTYEPFEEICKEENLKPEVSGPLLARMKTRVPEKRGTGKYIQVQEDLFDKVRQHLAGGGYVAAGTRDQIMVEKKDSKTGKGHSGGEPVAEGLTGKHAYSVLAAREIDGPGGEKRKYLRLRNPWGKSESVGTGRMYKELPDGTLDIVSDPKVLEKQAKPEFDMELTDFTKQFSKVYYG